VFRASFLSGGGIVVGIADLSLVVDHLEETFVVLVLVLVHAGVAGSHFLISDLAVKEISVLGVNVLDFTVEAFFLSLEEFLVLLPHDGLLVVEGFLLTLAVLLLSHLSVQVLTGFELASLGQFHAFLIFKTETEFTLLFVFVDLFIFSGLASVLRSDDSRSHSVHEVLGAFLTSTELVLTVFLLFVEHAGVFLLGIHIFLAFALFKSKSLDLLFFVLLKHFLKVHLLLLSLVVEHLTLSIHLLLQSVDQLQLLVMVSLLLNTASLLLELELTVAAFFFNLDFGLVRSLLLHFLLSEELDVLSLHLVIFCTLRHFSALSLALLSHLVVQLFLNESLALLLTLKGLLLLLVVQQSVEFLDSEPLVLLVNLGVDVGLPRLDSAPRDLGCVVSSTVGLDTHGLSTGREGVN